MQGPGYNCLHHKERLRYKGNKDHLSIMETVDASDVGVPQMGGLLHLSHTPAERWVRLVVTARALFPSGLR